MEDQEDISPYSKEIAKGSFWSLSGQVLFKLISFFYVVLIARMASQDDIGLFYLVFSVMSMVAVFSHFGLPLSLVRYVPFFEGRNEKGKIKHMLNLGYTSITIIGLILTAAMWLSADSIGTVYQNAKLPDAIRMFSVYLLFSNILQTNIRYLQARADIKSMQFIQTLQNGLKLLFTLLFFYLYGPSVHALIAGFLGSQIVSILFALPLVRKRTIDLPTRGETISRQQLLGEMLPFGLMLTIVSSFGILLHEVDKLLLAYFTDPMQATSVVALYTMATTLASVLLIFAASIGNVFLPLMSRLAGKNDTGQMGSVTETAQRWVLFITMPIAIVFVAFSADLLGIFYGISYRSGALAMSIFSLGILVASFSSVLSFALAAMRLVRIELKVAGAAAFTNIVLNLVLIPPFGMEGAALASAISLLLMFVLLYHYSRKLFDFHIPGSIFKMLAAGMATFLIMLALQPLASSLFSAMPEFGDAGMAAYISKGLYLAYVSLLVAVSIVLFAVFSLLLRCFRKEDVLLMKKVLLKARFPGFIVSTAEKIASWGLESRK